MQSLYDLAFLDNLYVREHGVLTSDSTPMINWLKIFRDEDGMKQGGLIADDVVITNRRRNYGNNNDNIDDDMDDGLFGENWMKMKNDKTNDDLSEPPNKRRKLNGGKEEKINDNKDNSNNNKDENKNNNDKSGNGKGKGKKDQKSKRKKRPTVRLHYNYQFII